MAFLDQVSRKLSKAGQDVAQSTKNFTAISKINGLIDEESERINGCYMEIGRIYFENFKDSPDTSVYSLVETVKASRAMIAKYNEEIKEIKGITDCPNCGNEVPYSSAFCNYCGTKMPERRKEEVIPEGSMICKKCGNALYEGFKFCTFCGNPVEAPVVMDPPVERRVDPSVKACPICDKQLPFEAAFCTDCGYKF